MVRFEVCPNCQRHGHIVLNGADLPEVVSQRAAVLQLLALSEVQLVTEAESGELLKVIDSSPLPKTDSDALAIALAGDGIIDQLMVLGMAMEVSQRRPSDIARHAGAFPG